MVKLIIFLISLSDIILCKCQVVKYIWSGTVTDTSAVVNAKITMESNVRLQVSPDSLNFTSPLFSEETIAEEILIFRVL